MEETDRLKKIDDNTFQEVKSAGIAPTNKQLEWRKSFNLVKFPISNLQIGHRFDVNEVDIGINGDARGFMGNRNQDIDPLFKRVKPNPIVTRRIVGECSDYKDRLYRVIPDEKGAVLYKCEKLPDKISIQINECEDDAPSFGEKFPKGLFNELCKLS